MGALGVGVLLACADVLGVGVGLARVAVLDWILQPAASKVPLMRRENNFFICIWLYSNEDWGLSQPAVCSIVSSQFFRRETTGKGSCAPLDPPTACTDSNRVGHANVLFIFPEGGKSDE